MRGALPGLLLLCCISCRLGTGYVMQEVSGCTFGDNKQGNFSYDYSFFFNRQLLLEYSEEEAMFVPCYNCISQMYEAAQNVCHTLNKDPDTANHVKEEERRCKEAARTYWEKTVERRVKPSVEVFAPELVHTESLPVLVCHVSSFYPGDIMVAWFRNNQLVRNYTEAVRAGDWTYQIVATLDLRNSQPEDNFTCLVDHPSLEMPIVKNWKYGLTNTQIVKITVATAIFVIGLATLITGVLCWNSSKRSGYTPIPGYNEAN